MDRVIHSKILKIIAKSLLVIFISLVFFEIVLRVQQKLGSALDLNNFELPLLELNLMDDTLNHIPVQKNRDENGIKTFRHPCENNRQSIKVLFLGDSFMQGRGRNTIPQGAFNYIHKVRGDKNCLSYL
jgi:hypothetical protein